MQAERALRGIIGGLPEGDPQRAILLPHLHAIESQALLGSLDFEKFPKTEFEVREELARLADRYINFGLNKHPQIRMAGGVFKDSLVALARPQPENFGGRVDIPVAVLGQVPPSDVYRAAGADYYLEDLNVRDWPDDPLGYTTPQGLYLAWVDTGMGNLGTKVDDVRWDLKAGLRDLRGMSENDGGGLYVAHPRILEHHGIDFLGTSVESDFAPYLSLFHGWPEVHCDWTGGAYPKFGSALCGRN